MKRWFEEQGNVNLMQWPSKGCDLNPIENIWANIVNTWEPEEERNRANLVAHANREWEVLRKNQNLVYNIVESVPRRMQECIDAEGGWTHY